MYQNSLKKSILVYENFFMNTVDTLDMDRKQSSSQTWCGRSLSHHPNSSWIGSISFANSRTSWSRWQPNWLSLNITCWMLLLLLCLLLFCFSLFLELSLEFFTIHVAKKHQNRRSTNNILTCDRYCKTWLNKNFRKQMALIRASDTVDQYTFECSLDVHHIKIRIRSEVNSYMFLQYIHSTLPLVLRFRIKLFFTCLHPTFL